MYPYTLLTQTDTFLGKQSHGKPFNFGDKVHIYRRENSRFWQCATYLAGKNRRVSTKEESLSLAKDIAEDWYLELRGKHRRGEIKNETTFKQAAEKFYAEYEVIT